MMRVSRCCTVLTTILMPLLTAKARPPSTTVATNNINPADRPTPPSSSPQALLRGGHTGGGNDHQVLHGRRLTTYTDCVTAGCGTTGTCTDSIELGCDAPSTFICEYRWPGYNVCESPPMANLQPCWMFSLDDALALNEISLPGTHDTMAKGSSACLQDGIGNLVHTQTWSLRTMLDAGVRALDIRLRYSENSFILEHGIIALPYTFDEDVRDVLVNFLQDNPSETVLMFYQVNDLDSSTRTWQESLQASLDENNPEMWTDGLTVPTLGESRGKIVLANDMQRKEQNEYMVTWATIDDKKSYIREFFEEGSPEDNVLRVNYMSGTGGMLPKTVAAGIAADALNYRYEGTNEIVFEYSEGCLGIVMFDFIGEDAIAHIVAQQGTGAPTKSG